MIRAIVWDLGGTLVCQPDGGQDRLPLDTYPEVQLRAGAKQALTIVKSLGYVQAILSNTAVSDESAVRRLLDRLEVERFFSVVVATRSELDRTRPGKPDQVVFEDVLSRLGVRAERAVMVGNSFDHDVLGALGCGMHALWITNPKVSVGDPKRLHGQAFSGQLVKIFDLVEVEQALAQIQVGNR